MPRLVVRSAKKRALARPPPLFYIKKSLKESTEASSESKSPSQPKAQPLKKKPNPKKFRPGPRSAPRLNEANSNLQRALNAIERNEPHFRVGGKQIYLPIAKVVLLRPNAKHTPYQAKFVVPRYFNKLDLRDYLYHVYGLRALNVTTQLLWARWTRQTPRSPRYRESQIKKMTIDMIDPFVWPVEPSEKTREEMLNLNVSKELSKFSKDVLNRLGSDKNKEPSAFGGLVGPFPEPPRPFIPKYFQKAANSAKNQAELDAKRLQDEAVVRRFLKL